MKIIFVFILFFLIINSVNSTTKITYYYIFWNSEPIVDIKTSNLLNYKYYDDSLKYERYLIDGIFEIADSNLIYLIKNKINDIKQTKLSDINANIDCRIALIIDSCNVKDTVGIGKRNIEINGVLYPMDIELLTLLKYFQPKFYSTEIDTDILKLFMRKTK